METKYLGYRFSSVKITASSCLWIWFAGIHLWIQQTKHLQCSESRIHPKYSKHWLSTVARTIDCVYNFGYSNDKIKIQSGYKPERDQNTIWAAAANHFVPVKSEKESKYIQWWKCLHNSPHFGLLFTVYDENIFNLHHNPWKKFSAPLLNFFLKCKRETDFFVVFDHKN